MPSITLPADFLTRPATRDDAQAISAICVEHELAAMGVSESTPNDILELWDNEQANLEADTRVVTTLDGKLIGYTCIVMTKRGIMLDPNTTVHSPYKSQPIGSYLLQFAEERAHTLLQANPTCPRRFYTWSFTPDAFQLFEQHGFTVEESDYRMRIVFDAPLPEPRALDGIIIRPFIPNKEEHAMYDVIAEAFPDIDGVPYRPYEDWYEKVFVKTSSAEPSMFYVAVDGHQVVGTTLCRIYPEVGDGFIWQVAVRRAWRKRGIALNLLYTAFGEYYRRGIRQVLLDVNSLNQTGAYELYIRAGMHKRSQVNSMTKAL
jgi:mycothiol synthase